MQYIQILNWKVLTIDKKDIKKEDYKIVNENEGFTVVDKDKNKVKYYLRFLIDNYTENKHLKILKIIVLFNIALFIGLFLIKYDESNVINKLDKIIESLQVYEAKKDMLDTKKQNTWTWNLINTIINKW